MMGDSRKGSIVPGDVRSDSEQPMSTQASGKKAIRPNQTLKLKKQAPKYSKPGNWREGSTIDQDGTGAHKSKFKPSKSTVDANTTPSTQEATSPGPVVTQLDDTAREAFATGRPLGDSPDMVQCKHCKKTFIKGKAAKEHIQKCLEDKKEAIKRRKEAKEKAAATKADEEKKKGGKASGKADAKDKKYEPVDADGDVDMDKDASGSDADAPGESASMSPEVSKKPGPTELKGRKKTAGKNTADGEKKMGKKRKAEDEAGKVPKKKKKDEPKPKTAKAKMPVDVERQCGVITPNGVPCARSLTCKSHSMGAKRAVPGRSLPYQMLLAAYQKKNQAKQQKAAIDANAPLEDDDELATGPVDSDEETVAVMNALSKWRPQPVVPQPVLVPIKKQYQLARLREQLDNATSGGMVNIFAVKTKNGSKIGETTAEGEGGEEDAEGERDDSFPTSTAPILPQQNLLRRQGTFNLGQVAAARIASVGAGGR